VPLYEYECQKCGQHVERIEKYKGPYLKKCLACGGRLERIVSRSAIQFKGSGWYVTDYARPSSGTPPGKQDGDGASEKSAGNSDAKGDAKPNAKDEAKPSARPKEEKKPTRKEK
jgi:putative FmdB family regulatory protein